MPVTITGRVTHGADPVPGVYVAVEVASDQGVPAGADVTTTDSNGVYTLVLDRLGPAAGRFYVSVTDQNGNSGGVGGNLSSETITADIAIMSASERAALATPVPTPIAEASATPAASGGGRGGSCCGLSVLLPALIVTLVAGSLTRRQKK
jgi:hypothetical protein